MAGGRRRRRKRPGRRSRRVHLWAGLLVLVLCGGLWGGARMTAPARRVARLEKAVLPAFVEEALLPVGNARSGQRLADIQGVVIHYVGNPGTTARNNRNYFAQETTQVSAHFVVGLEGEVVQCVPLWERSAASNQRNRDTISIEVCHPDEDGAFLPETYEALVELTAWLCRTAHLKPAAVIRHYDVTGKLCPLYYVRHPEAWEDFLADVSRALEG